MIVPKINCRMFVPGIPDPTLKCPSWIFSRIHSYCLVEHCGSDFFFWMLECVVYLEDINMWPAGLRASNESDYFLFSPIFLFFKTFFGVDSFTLTLILPIPGSILFYLIEKLSNINWYIAWKHDTNKKTAFIKFRMAPSFKNSHIQTCHGASF